MFRSTLLAWTATLLPLVAATGCATGKKGDALVQVNDLVTLMEKVHTDSELATQRVHAAVDEFQRIVTFHFKTDAVAAYTEFATAVDTSTQGLAQLRQDVDAMKRAADPVFKRWAADLDAFQSMELRLRSQQRLAEARQRYDAIVAAADPTLATFTSFNQRLQDYSVFLKHDLNEASLAALTGDAKSVGEMKSALDLHFVACQEAVRSYVSAAALPAAAAPPAAAETPGATKPKAPRADG